jgi:precorrin-2 dehydrogenase/sirohydrochlorin ferrochelatase
MRYYPVFLHLRDKKAVVIGGGRIAERKVLTLIKAGSKVTLISPEITDRLERLRKKGLLTYIKRNYRKGDLKDAFIVIAGTPSEQVNKKIARDARHLINVIDNPSEGNFIVPSIVRRGPLTIAISTEGISPAMAKAIRKELEKQYDSEFGRYLKFLESMRKKALNEIKDKKERERFLKSLASKEIFNILRKKDTKRLFKQIKAEFSSRFILT